MGTYVYLADDTVSPRLAVDSVSDYIGTDTTNVRAVKIEDTAWGRTLLSDLDIDEVAAGRVVHTPLDTVIGPPIEDLVAKVREAGAEYLDITQGLIPIEVVADETVTESPDTEVLPEPKPKPTTAKKATAKKAPAKRTRAPLPEVPEAPKADPAPEATQPAPATSENETQTVTVDSRGGDFAAAEPPLPTGGQHQLSLVFDDVVAHQLQALVGTMLPRANTEDLWRVLDVLRAR